MPLQKEVQPPSYFVILRKRPLYNHHSTRNKVKINRARTSYEGSNKKDTITRFLWARQVNGPHPTETSRKGCGFTEATACERLVVRTGKLVIPRERAFRYTGRHIVCKKGEATLLSVSLAFIFFIFFLRTNSRLLITNCISPLFYVDPVTVFAYFILSTLFTSRSSFFDMHVK